ncbi:MAG: hypothetical protein ACREBS_10240 [Nitrososphaerales archaeon]
MVKEQRTSPRMSEYLVAHTRQEDMAKSILSHKDIAIPYLSSVKVWRERWRCQICSRCQYEEIGEALNHRRNNGHAIEQMFYEIDIQLYPPRKIGLEIYGAGTSSFDKERQRFLKAQGWQIYYYPNLLLERFPECFEQFCRLLKKAVEGGLI